MVSKWRLDTGQMDQPNCLGGGKYNVKANAVFFP